MRRLIRRETYSLEGIGTVLDVGERRRAVNIPATRSRSRGARGTEGDRADRAGEQSGKEKRIRAYGGGGKRVRETRELAWKKKRSVRGFSDD